LNPIFKWLTAVAAGIAVLVLALVLALSWLFDANAYKSEIEAWVEKETGLALSLAGDVSLSLFPRLSLEVGPAALRNPPGFGAGNLAQFEALALRVKLGSLLAGAVVPDLVAVEGLKVRLVRAVSGRHNYDSLLAPRHGAGGPPPAALAFGGLTVANAELSYQDQTSGETLSITDLNFRSGAFSAGGAASVTAQFQFGHSGHRLQGQTSVEAELSTDQALRLYHLKLLAADATLGGPGPSERRSQLRSTGNAGYDAESRVLSLENVEVAATNPDIIDAPVRVRIPKAALDLAAGTATVERFSVNALEVNISGELGVSALGADPALKGNIRVAGFNPRLLLTRLGGPPPDTAADGWPNEARLETRVSGDRRGLTLNPVALTLDTVLIGGRIDLGFGPEWPLTTSLRAEGLRGAHGDPLALALRGSGRVPEGASTYRVDDLELTLGPVSARGKIELNANGEIPTYTASLELPSFDPRALLDHLGQAAPETGDPKALTRLSASAVVTGSGTDLILEPLTLKLDDTQVTGTLSVSDGLSESRAMKFDLRADALDSGRYLPFTFPGTEQEAPTLASLGALWSLDLNGRLRLEALTVGDVIIDDVEVVARSRSGRLELQSGSVSPRLTPGGRIAASASLTQPPS
jgi:hypothetical protein